MTAVKARATISKLIRIYTFKRTVYIGENIMRNNSVVIC